MCASALTVLGAFTQQLTDDLVALRPLVVAKAFDSAATVTAMRRASQTLTSYDGLAAGLRRCPQAEALAVRVEDLRARTDPQLAKSHEASITDAAPQRAVAAALYGLLSDVIALSEAGREVGATLGVQVAQVSDGAGKPIGSLAPLPTPRPTPKPTPPPAPPKVASITASYFGSGVKVSTYKVTGTTPQEISRSIQSRGPYSGWLGGRAEGLTKSVPTYRFSFQSDGYGGCDIVVERKPAIRITFTIVLPRWAVPSRVSTATIKWWNAEIKQVAKHEKVHVDIIRAAAKRLNSTLASSTCGNAERRLDAIWADAQRANCEFDMKEYGTASGLSLKACLAR